MGNEFPLEEMKKILARYKEGKIKFMDYANAKMAFRSVDREEVAKALLKPDMLKLAIKKQGYKNRFDLVFEKDAQHALIVAIDPADILYVINALNKTMKVEDLVRKWKRFR